STLNGRRTAPCPAETMTDWRVASGGLPAGGEGSGSALPGRSLRGAGGGAVRPGEGVGKGGSPRVGRGRAGGRGARGGGGLARTTSPSSVPLRTLRRRPLVVVLSRSPRARTSKPGIWNSPSVSGQQLTP